MTIPTLAAAQKWINRAKATLEAGVCANSSSSGPGLVSLGALVGPQPDRMVQPMLSQGTRFSKPGQHPLVPLPHPRLRRPQSSPLRSGSRSLSDSSCSCDKGKGIHQ